MRRGKKIRHIIEFGAFRFAAFLIERLSARAASVLAEAMGDAVWVLGRDRRHVACANILKAGAAPDEANARRIGRAASRHVGAVLVESWKMMPGLASDRWADHIEYDIDPAARKLLQDSAQSMILVSAHLGNWELGACLVATMKPVHAVVRSLNNPYVDAFVARRSHRNRMLTVPKHVSSRRPFLKVLKHGEALGLLVDQHARAGGIVVDFLGHPAATYTSPARLHFASGAPIVLVACIRTGRMRYRLTVGPPIVAEKSGDRGTDVRNLTVTLNDGLGKWILRYPEQYLWAHRRWR